MAITATLNSGTLTVVGDSGTDTTVLVNDTGTALSLSGGGQTWVDGGGMTDAGFVGFGNTTMSGPTASITVGAIFVFSGTTNVLNVRQAYFPLTFSPSAGTNTINLSSVAPLISGSTAFIRGNVNISQTGSAIVNLGVGPATGGGETSTTVTASSVTDCLGVTGNAYSVFYSSINSLSYRIRSAGTVTVIDTPASTTITSGTGSSFFNAQKISHSTSMTFSSGSDTVTFGSAAGSLSGLDSIDSPCTINGAGGNNTIRIDDTGSATGNKTYMITPAATQITNSTISGSSFSTISYTCTGSGTFASGLRFDGSNVGGNTFIISSNFLDNAIINGNGGNTNFLDFTALSGYVDSPNGDGTGVVTLSNGKTITYSGIEVSEVVSEIDSIYAIFPIFLDDPKYKIPSAWWDGKGNFYLNKLHVNKKY